MRRRAVAAFAGALLCVQPALADCLDDAARFHHVNVVLVRAIAQQESGMRANAVNRNTDGSEDIGLMQINSSWLPKLRRYGVTRESLFNPCVNGYVGTWILASNIRQFGPTWKAVGAYNAVSTNKQLVYANHIYRRVVRGPLNHMKPMIIMPTRRRASLLAKVFALLATTGLANAAFPQSDLLPPAGGGWQMLSADSHPAGGAASLAMVEPAHGAPASSHASQPLLTPAQAASPTLASTAVTPVVLPGAPAVAGSSSLSLSITPQDINLRNALDRWLQQQGWQLAWKIDDDLPLEFNATFSGDFDSVLTQVMRATNHMRTPTRVCEHSNNVIRVVARAANCQD